MNGNDRSYSTTGQCATDCENTMNERIKQLIEQATTIEHGVDNGFDRVTFDKEKFAELIVRECIDIVSPYAIRMENFDGGHPIADLKKHFGVEE